MLEKLENLRNSNKIAYLQKVLPENPETTKHTEANNVLKIVKLSFIGRQIEHYKLESQDLN